VPLRNRRKSKAEGLYKRCRHLSWDKCPCLWWGRFKGQRVSLEKWAGTPIGNKELAKGVLGRMHAAILGDSFDKRGERAALLTGGLTFTKFLDEYTKRHIEEDGLRSNSIDSYIDVYRDKFGKEKLSALAANPYVFEKWLKDAQQENEWEDSTYNRYVEHGRAMFNWAKARKLVSENPFYACEAKPEHNQRDVRITPEQEQKLLDACELLNAAPKAHRIKLTWDTVNEIRLRAASGEQQKTIAQAFTLSTGLVSQIVNRQIWNPGARKPRTVGNEMKRRLIAAIDLGLRQGEMLRLQVKHVNYETWSVLLPATITKAERDQEAFAMTARLQVVLQERRFLGPDAYLFGREDGGFVASFDKSWTKLFKLAGLTVGRKDGYVWHDLRHEFGSYLIEQGATIQETKELMRHADIRTTSKYLKANDDRLRELAGRMSTRRA
jgi:site-specific recombinase XerD